MNFTGETWAERWKSRLRCWRCGTDHEIFARSIGPDSRFFPHRVPCHGCGESILRVGDNLAVLVKSVKPNVKLHARKRPNGRPLAKWAKRHNIKLRDLEDVFENYAAFDARLYARTVRTVLTDRELAVLGLRWNEGYTWRKIGELAKPKLTPEAVRNIHGRALWNINRAIRQLEKGYE